MAPSKWPIVKTLWNESLFPFMTVVKNSFVTPTTNLITTIWSSYRVFRVNKMVRLLKPSNHQNVILVMAAAKLSAVIAPIPTNPSVVVTAMPPLTQLMSLFVLGTVQCPSDFAMNSQPLIIIPAFSAMRSVQLYKPATGILTIHPSVTIPNNLSLVPFVLFMHLWWISKSLQ